MRNPFVSVAAFAVAAAFGCSDGEERDGAGAGGGPCITDAGTDADPCDWDGDGYRAVSCGGDDCDDSREDIHPGAVEVCDGDDNDCDGEADQDDACDCAAPAAEPTLPYTERVCLKGGWLWMGMGYTDPHAAENGYKASPMHRVFVSPVYMGRYEVTSRRYIACLDAGACTLQPYSAGDGKKKWDRAEHETPEQLDRPFLGGSAKNAAEFCKWDGGRLPSEAEWERGAAGLGDKPRPYPSGYVLPTCDEEVLYECAVSDGITTYRLPDRVGLKKPNPDGLFDMGGNALEFVADPVFWNAYEACDTPCKNPCNGCESGLNEFGMDGHIARGGSAKWSTPPQDAPYLFRSQLRDGAAKDSAQDDISGRGFRCAYPAKAKR